MGVKNFTDLAWISREAETKLSDLVELQGEIENGAFGPVKKAYVNGSSVATVGNGFQAWNASGAKQYTGTIAIMGKDYNDRPFFYRGGDGVSGSSVFNGFFYDLGDVTCNFPAYSAVSSASSEAFTSFRNVTIPASSIMSICGSHSATFSGDYSGGSTTFLIEFWSAGGLEVSMHYGQGYNSDTSICWTFDYDRANDSAALWGSNITKVRGRIAGFNSMGGGAFSASCQFGFGSMTYEGGGTRQSGVTFI